MSTVGERMAAALDWAAAGEGEVPDIIRDLPDDEQAVLLGGAHELAEVVRQRVEELFGPGATT